MDPFAHAVITHQNKIPGLHEADGRGVVTSPQDPGQHVIRDTIGQELRTNVAPFEDTAVNGFTFFGRKRVGIGNGGP